MLTIQAEGNYQGAKDLIAKYAVNSPTIETLRKKLESLPVDIKPEIPQKRNLFKTLDSRLQSNDIEIKSTL